MSRLYPERAVLRRPFVVTRYVRDRGGELIAEVPACCPAGAVAGKGEPECRIGIHHRRERKTGPGIVFVASCRQHGLGFTLYPPAYAPYRRQPLARLAPDGQAVGGVESREGEFVGTLFEAALDAKEGRAWTRDSSEQWTDKWWGTQGRHLDLAARLVGVAKGLSDRLRSSLAAVLRQSTLLLREGMRAQGYRELGASIWAVLSQLRGGKRGALRLLWCGYLIGSWGKPLSWDAERFVLERDPFPDVGTIE